METPAYAQTDSGPLEIGLPAPTADAPVSPQVQRRIEIVVRSQMSRWRGVQAEDLEDVVSDTVAAVWAKTEEQTQAIQDMEAYAAGIARRMCSAWLRQRRPEFHRLRSRLRYHLRQDPRFGLWQDEKFAWVCGWQEDEGKPAGAADAVESAILQASLPAAETLARMFRIASGPVAFNDLARICARLWGIQDDVDPVSDVDIASPQRSPLPVMQSREQLVRLWSELRLLPARQAAALLLNLRAPDGECATALLVLTGTATLRQLAAVTEIPAEEFAALWSRLPLNDLEIAERMGLSRQQVINLRKCARERLRRRLSADESYSW